MSDWDDLEVYELQSKEISDANKDAGQPHMILAKNLRYFIKKYNIRVFDFQKHYRYVRISRSGLYNTKNGKNPNLSMSYICLLRKVINEAYHLNLTFADLFTDLESRDKMKEF